MINRNIRVILGLCGVLTTVALGIGLTDGCGGHSQLPIPSTSPSPTLGTGIGSVRAVYSLQSGVRQVRVSWDKPADIPQSRIVEYHVSRDDTLIAATPASTIQFVDTVFSSASEFTYNVVGENSVSIVTKTSNGTPLTFGVSHTYLVRVLFQQDNGTFAETTVGLSSPVAVPGF